MDRLCNTYMDLLLRDWILRNIPILSIATRGQFDPSVGFHPKKSGVHFKHSYTCGLWILRQNVMKFLQKIVKHIGLEKKFAVYLKNRIFFAFLYELLFRRDFWKKSPFSIRFSLLGYEMKKKIIILGQKRLSDMYLGWRQLTQNDRVCRQCVKWKNSRSTAEQHSRCWWNDKFEVRCLFGYGIDCLESVCTLHRVGRVRNGCVVRRLVSYLPKYAVKRPLMRYNLNALIYEGISLDTSHFALSQVHQKTRVQAREQLVQHHCRLPASKLVQIIENPKNVN